MAHRLVLVCLLVACRDKPTSSSAQDNSREQSRDRSVLSGAVHDASSVDPWAPIDAAPDTPERQRARVEAALTRVPTILESVSKLRELTVLRDVSSAYQTADDYRAFVRKEIEKELPPKRSAELSAALFHMGFLEKRVDIATATASVHTTQVVAYYDPRQQKFFVVTASKNDDDLDMISSHELTHALQDQHFDLLAYVAEQDPPNSDAQIARRFVGEGDATYTMLLHQITANNPANISADWLRRRARTTIEDLAQMAPDDAMASLDSGWSSLDPEVKKQQEARREIPQMLIVPMFESYLQGAHLVMLAHDRGGWAAVDELFRVPPESTEQVLHPATKLFGKREHPRKVALSSIGGATKIDEDTIGELRWYIYFSLWAPAARVPASQGWGGDRYWVGKRRDGRVIAATVTTWDTSSDATEFATAYELSIAARFPRAKRTADGGFVRPDGGKIYVFRSKRDVYIVDGADEARVLDAIIGSAKIGD